MNVYGNITFVGNNSRVKSSAEPIEDSDLVTKDYYFNHLPSSLFNVVSELTNETTKVITLPGVGAVRAIDGDGSEVICSKTYSGTTVTLDFSQSFTGSILYVDSGSIVSDIINSTGITVTLPSVGIVDIIDSSGIEIVFCTKKYSNDGLSVDLSFNPAFTGKVIFVGSDAISIDISNETIKILELPGTGIVSVRDVDGFEVLSKKVYSHNGVSATITLEFDSSFTGKAVYVNTQNNPDIIDILYNDFVTVINSSKLKPGKHYKITDYRTINSISDSGATYEPLIVFALTNDIISNRAYSQINSSDLIDYDYSMNLAVDNTIRPGYITHRIDIYNINSSDTGLTLALSAETIARISGDTYLQYLINNIPLVDTGLTLSLSAETIARISGDTYLQEQINSGITVDVINNSIYFGVLGSSGITNSIFLGNSAGSIATNASYSNFLGLNSGFESTYASNSNFLGQYTGYQSTNAFQSNFLGYYSGFQATGASNSNFLGQETGFNSTDANNSNFLGYHAGYQSTNASHSNFLGYISGSYATDANNSNFLGNQAGYQSTNASHSNFLGYSAGCGATNASHSNFLGNQAGYQATDAIISNFLGYFAGYQATNATKSNFMGHYSGYVAGYAFQSNFLGYGSGYQSTSASNSNFFGDLAGAVSANASNSIFIGQKSGYQDVVNNTGNTDDYSILIGKDTSTSGFSNSIAIGGSAINTKSNELMIGSTLRPINYLGIAGVNYTLPTGNTTGNLTNDGNGVLTWMASSGGASFGLSLSPAGANLVGSINEPTLSVVTGTNRKYDILSFIDSTNNICEWLIGEQQTKGYTSGDINIDIFWKASSITGVVTWNVKMKGFIASEGIDVVLDASTLRTVTTTVQGVSETLNKSTITFTPNSNELTSGDIVFISLKRDTSDTMSGDAKLLNISIY